MHCESAGSDEMTQQVATAFLLRAWEQVSPQTLENAWFLYYEEEGE
jgi:hypothetical protein